jgi:hypothetical protein
MQRIEHLRMTGVVLGLVAGMWQAAHGQTQQTQTPPSPAPSKPPVTPNRFDFQPGGSRPGTFSGIGQVGPGIDLLTSPIRERLVFDEQPPLTPWVQPPQRVWTSPSIGYEGPAWWWLHARSGASGTSVQVAAAGPRWSFQLNLTDATPALVVDRCCAGWVPAPVCTYPLFGWTYPSGTFWGTGLTAIGPSTYGRDSRLYQAPAAPAAPTAATPAASSASPATTAIRPLELANYAIVQRVPKVAIEALKREIREQGEQPETLRRLALALAMDRRWDDAGAVMRAAYRLDPKLGGTPLPLIGLEFDAMEWRALVAKAVSVANKGKSGSDWLLVAAFMQAEGREALAARMLERAAKNGLEPEIVAGFPAAAKQGR